MVANTTIPQLHFEHQLWINELNFYLEEIKLFENYLSRTINGNSSKEIVKGVEHFRSQFVLQKEIIHNLKHELMVADKRLVAFVKELSGLGLDSIRIDNHIRLRDRVKSFREIYSVLKTDFRRFEAEWL